MRVAYLDEPPSKWNSRFKQDEHKLGQASVLIMARPASAPGSVTELYRVRLPLNRCDNKKGVMVSGQ
jgi:hypothetical protein